MRLWIDTEFNGFEGELISLALVAESGEACYIIRDAIKDMEIDPWVDEHVMPHIFKNPEGFDLLPSSDDMCKRLLQNFLNMFGEDVEIIADWPEDIHHLCKFMITGPGWMIHTPTNMTFTLDRGLDSESEVPHNAWYDALANMAATLNREYGE